MSKSIAILIICIFLGTEFPNAQNHQIQVDVSKYGAPIQKTMWGIFFEDINFGADGGLYAEMIKNRSFENPQNLMGWKSFGEVEIRSDDAPFPNNPNYVRLSLGGTLQRRTGIENEGYFGISVKKDAEYRFSVWARNPVENSPITFSVYLVDQNGNNFCETETTVSSKDWKKYEVSFKPTKTEAKGLIRIIQQTAGTVDLDHISLLPVDTWKGHKNGLRKDLAQVLYDLHPGVFRFPGGCIVEGVDLATRYQWKNSIGQVENRKQNENMWVRGNENRVFPDYTQSYGLGFYEFFQFSEEIGAEPLPVVNCGLACQIKNIGEKAHAKVTELDPYIQEALDLIEFANGGVTTKWGKIRCEMGHPGSFNLRKIGVGNEQLGKLYYERLEPFVKSIHSKYPDIEFVGYHSEIGRDAKYSMNEMKRLKVDLVDEHFYQTPEWFLANANKYDSYDRKGPAIFVGEYACHSKDKKNNFESALAEAAFLTGVERNADIVHMCTYAPLLAHVQGWQWKPDLIWFDNMSSVRSVNYYVQQLYALNPGTNVLRTFENNTPLVGQGGIYASSVVDKNKKELILKIANTSELVKTVTYTFIGLKAASRKGLKIVLKSDNLDSENTLENPNAVVPITDEISILNNELTVELAPKSFSLFTIQL